MLQQTVSFTPKQTISGNRKGGEVPSVRPTRLQVGALLASLMTSQNLGLGLGLVGGRISVNHTDINDTMGPTLPEVTDKKITTEGLGTICGSRSAVRVAFDSSWTSDSLSLSSATRLDERFVADCRGGESLLANDA
jgi:hypothetical protein